MEEKQEKNWSITSKKTQLENSSLFLHPSKRNNLLINFKYDRLFRLTQSINQNVKPQSSQHRNSELWLNQITYIEQSTQYSPKKSLQCSKIIEKQNLFNNTLISKKILDKKKSHQSRAKTLKNQKAVPAIQNIRTRLENKKNWTVHTNKNREYKECFTNKMHALKKPSNSLRLIQEKIFKNVFPNFCKKSFNKTLSQLKLSKHGKSINLESLSINQSNHKNINKEYDKRKIKKQLQMPVLKKKSLFQSFGSKNIQQLFDTQDTKIPYCLRKIL